MYMPQDTINIREDRLGNTAGEVVDTTNQKVSFDNVVADLARLKQVVVQETMLLKRQKLKEVRELHDEKLRLIRRLEISKQILRQHPEYFTGQRETHREAIRGMFNEMDGVLAENLKEVAKARFVNEQVVQAVVRAVKMHDGQVSGYNNYGTMADAPAAVRNTVTTALSINQKA